jgi:hypothetical protein
VHVPFTQVWPEGHALPHDPQCALDVRRDASHPSEKVPLQSAKELLHNVIVQAVPEHPAVATFGAEHGEHALPHVLGLVSDAHVVPQRWEPVEHCPPQLLPEHVAVPPEGAEHARHAPPLAPVPHSEIDCAATHPLESQQPFAHELALHATQAPAEQIAPDPQVLP